MRVLLLTKYGRLGASSRLRTYQYVPHLEERGIQVLAAPLLRDEYVDRLYRGSVSIIQVLRYYLSRLSLLRRANKFDVLWVEKELFPWLPFPIERALYPRRIPIVVDYDDAIFHRYDHHRSFWIRALLGKKIDSVMRRANLVVAGNQYLKDRAQRARAMRVETLPTVVSVAKYVPVAVRPKGHVTIGWIGSPLTCKYLLLISRAINEIVATRNVRVVAVGADAEYLRELPIETRRWSEQTEVSEIQDFDIGIMPLPDEPFERGKCGYKLIQYMACGKPVVASPVGENTVIVRDGVDGFLPRSVAAWTADLIKLCDEPLLRERFGAAGRARVEEEYSLEVMTPRLESLLRSVASTSD
ncbi:MAG: glycosyltransferase family 4 protein [Betaproteobacteria bacterium]|nr:MAG: glycosyltransferase family 4 protein [Betaproteobacteria bacterium]